MSWSMEGLNSWVSFNGHRETIRKCNQSYLMTWPWDSARKRSNYFCPISATRISLLKLIDHYVLSESLIYPIWWNINCKDNLVNYITCFRIHLPSVSLAQIKSDSWFQNDQNCLTPPKVWNGWALQRKKIYIAQHVPSLKIWITTHFASVKFRDRNSSKMVF